MATTAKGHLVPTATPDAPSDFSLVLGGPLYQFMRRLGLVAPPLARLKSRVLVITLFAWAPLLLLALLDGRALRGVPIPFLLDYEVHSRFLLSLPLLILAEVTIHRRVGQIVAQFWERGIIPPSMQRRFQDAVASSQRLRDSIPVELALLAFVFIAGGFISRQLVGLRSDTWYSAASPSGARATTPAGYWYLYVSIPVFQFILLRWYFRLIVWGRFLFHLSRLDLHLVPTHPDGACGLGFLDTIVFALAPFLLAHGCLLSGSIANRILHEGAVLTEFAVEIVALAVWLFLVALGPLCVFTPALGAARRLGMRAYGRFASSYVSDFHRKWITGPFPAEPLLGTSDIQSLADLDNSYRIVRSIIPFPFGRNSIVMLAVVIAIPLLPLALTMVSIGELAVRLLKLVL
jgi:hypothetical protein